MGSCIRWVLLFDCQQVASKCVIVTVYLDRNMGCRGSEALEVSS
jgi:hypothetical protein